MLKLNIQLLNYLMQFVVGGGIIVGMTVLAKSYGGKTAALLYALPVQFTIAAIFIHLDASEKTVKDLCIGTLYALLIIAAFIAVFYLFHSRFNFWLTLAASYLAFGICAWLYWKVIATQ